MRRSVVTVSLSALLVTAPVSVLAGPYDIQNAFPNLPIFDWPVDLAAPFDGSDRLFVCEKNTGKVYVFQNDPSVSTRKVFLDLGANLNTVGNAGLLSIAFHPDYETNGTFFVMYNTKTPYLSRWSRFQVSANPDSADPASEDVMIEIPQVNTCHKGCEIAFGGDGYLYISVGEDCQGWPSQNLTSLMGKMLRIDVNVVPPADYAIPPDNPFVGNPNGWREEIWAYGFRNPWRFSIDPETNRIFLGDVGEANWEEVDIVTKGRNYGWIKMEGFDCYPNPAACDTAGMNAVLPIWQYPHASEYGEAVTGGHIYRGHTVPSLWGKYVFSDAATGFIYVLTDNGGGNWTGELIYDAAPTKQFVTWGVDEEDELYVVSLFGRIYRIVDLGTDVDNRAPSATTLMAEPNPFQTSTMLRFETSLSAAAQIDIYDVAGRRVYTFPSAVLGRAGTASWNGTDDSGRKLASGVYFARLVIEGRIAASQRVVLVR